MIIKNKKGISVMIGYILLITTAIIVSTIIYQQLKSYVPTESVECPEGVSVFLKEVTYDCDNKELNITLKNNGRFNIGGYFIKGSDSPEKELATTDLSRYNEYGQGGAVILYLAEFSSQNSMSPNEEVDSSFNLSNFTETFYSVEIIPLRYQEVDSKNRLVSCGNSRIKESLTCYVPGSSICGNGTIDAGETCDDNNTISSDGCSGITCQEEYGYTCLGEPSVCTLDEILCGNGVINISEGEECDDGNEIIGDGCSNSCQIEAGYSCVGTPSDCMNEIIIFVSSNIFDDGNLGGISGADTSCNNLASGASLGGTFISWLSNDTLNAIDRIPGDFSGLPFVGTDDVKVADDLTDLTDGSIDSMINKNETGYAITDEDHVFTGTDTDGTAGNDNCDNWNNPAVDNMRGKSNEVSTKWTNENTKECSHSSRLYCFQVSSF